MDQDQGLRLREERLRLGLTQLDMGVAAKTQRFYEIAERSPDVWYLTALAEKGGDVMYVIKGERTEGAVSKEEAELLKAWRKAGEPYRRAVMAVLGVGEGE